jgi:hypothetical protein
MSGFEIGRKSKELFSRQGFAAGGSGKDAAVLFKRFRGRAIPKWMRCPPSGL